MISYCDYKALQHNIDVVRTLAPSCIPVVKGALYGCGWHAAAIVAGQFPVVAVANLDDAYMLSDEGLSMEGRTILVLNGVHAGVHRKYAWSIVPVLPYSAAKDAAIGTRYAVFLQGGCNRIPVSREQLDSLLCAPEFVLIHGADYRQPVFEVDPYLRLAEGATLSVGSGANLGRDDSCPRVGMAFAGYSSGEISLDLSPVKHCTAKVISDELVESEIGYGVPVSDLLSAARMSTPHIYSVNIGHYDNLYASHKNTRVYCRRRPDARVLLMTDTRLGAVSMNSSFIVSDTPLPYGSDVEILGPHVRADFLANLHGTSTANILRLGLQQP